MQRIKIYAVLLGTILGLVGLIPRVTAQEDKAKPEESTPKTAASRSGSAYRLEFALSELEDGKKINTRSYSMLAQAGGVMSKLRIGLRVPVAMANSQFQYMDVGMNIDCRVEEHEGSLMLSTTIESSNLTPAPAQNVSGPDHPVIRQVRADLSTVVNLGKPTLITSMDDPISRHQFQIEVTATKTK